MNHLRSMARRVLKDEEGIAITEYGMLVAFIALAVIVVLQIFGSNISSWFRARASQITSV